MYLYHLVYFSKRKPIPEAEFDGILETSRRNNAALGITGALFMDDSYYFQVLEGPRTALSELIAVILNDDRHLDVVLTLFEAIDQRMFGEWNMARLPCESEEIQKLFQHYMGQFDDPTMMSGGMIWDMIEAMADVSLNQLPAQKLM